MPLPLLPLRDIGLTFVATRLLSGTTCHPRFGMINHGGGWRSQPAGRTSDGGGGMSELELRHVESELEIAACYPVMVLLRPHLGGADELVARITRQRDAGYRLLALWRAGTPVALAGYRFEENLIHGKFVYVDDLVTAADERSGWLLFMRSYWL